MSVPPTNFLVVNGVPRGGEVPAVSALLQAVPGAAYTTTRTHGGASVVLFWERHLLRLANSVRILFAHRPASRTIPVGFPPSLPALQPLVERSLRPCLQVATGARGEGQELAITTIVSGDGGVDEGVQVYVHLGLYVPPLFGVGACLALVGKGRELAEAKYSDWARIRRYMEKLGPPQATELILSNDGDHILEGSVTNFFVVCRKQDHGSLDHSSDARKYLFEVQTAPVRDGVLPGVIRQVVIEVCLSRGIPVREVAPSWSDRERWEEAFITNSLRLMQHVETIEVPSSWGDLHSGRPISWVQKQFGSPGAVTLEIQSAILEGAHSSAYPITSFN